MLDLRPLDRLVQRKRDLVRSSQRDAAGAVVKPISWASMLALTVALGATTAAAAPATVSPASATSRGAAPHSWTLAEMQSATAQPLATGRLTRGGTASALSLTPPAPHGEPGFSPGHAPTSGPLAAAARLDSAQAADATSADALAAQIDATTATTPANSSYPSPYSRFQWTGGLRRFPIAAIGKLFFTQNGVPHFCSAAVVNKDRIMTAGHCVHGGDNSESSWATDMLFCPSYKNGPNPAVGCWSVTKLVASHDWYATGDLDRDWGGGTTASCGTVQCASIGDVTGWLGYAWNFQGEHVMAFGYPQDAPFNGSKLVTCAGQNDYTDNMGAGADSKYVGCDMTGGASGGPWILRFGEWNVLDGVNSHRRCADADCLDLEIGAAPFTDEPGGVQQFMGELFADR